MHRRERWEILGFILQDLSHAAQDGLGLTRMAQRANVPYDRFLVYLQELRDGGLIAGEPSTLTEKGAALLRSWQQWEAVLQRFGLD